MCIYIYIYVIIPSAGRPRWGGWYHAPCVCQRGEDTPNLPTDIIPTNIA